MKRIALRWVEAFRAVALTGTTSGAAELLDVGQSAISRYLASLEAQLGVGLFDRSQHRLKLTAEGEALLAEASLALEGLDRFRRTAEDIRLLRQGHLHLIAAANVARGLLPAAMSTFRTAHPRITFSMEVVARRELTRRIDDQRFDLALIALPYDYPAEATVPLGSFPGVCILPVGHALAARARIHVTDLAGIPFVGLPVGTIGRYQIDGLFQRAGVACELAVEASTGTPELVAAGLGVSIVDPFSAIGAQGMPIEVRPLEPALPYAFGMLFPLRRTRSDVAERFAAHLVRSAGDLSGHPAG